MTDWRRLGLSVLVSGALLTAVGCSKTQEDADADSAMTDTATTTEAMEEPMTEPMGTDTSMSTDMGTMGTDAAPPSQ